MRRASVDLRKGATVNLSPLHRDRAAVNPCRVVLCILGGEDLAVLQIHDVVCAHRLVLVRAIADVRIPVPRLRPIRSKRLPAGTQCTVRETDAAAGNVQFTLRADLQAFCRDHVRRCALLALLVVLPARRGLVVVQLRKRVQIEPHALAGETCAVRIYAVSHDGDLSRIAAVCRDPAVEVRRITGVAAVRIDEILILCVLLFRILPAREDHPVRLVHGVGLDVDLGTLSRRHLAAEEPGAQHIAENCAILRRQRIRSGHLRRVSVLRGTQLPHCTDVQIVLIANGGAAEIDRTAEHHERILLRLPVARDVTVENDVIAGGRCIFAVFMVDIARDQLEDVLSRIVVPLLLRCPCKKDAVVEFDILRHSHLAAVNMHLIRIEAAVGNIDGAVRCGQG